jgi:hypothetical protein
VSLGITAATLIGVLLRPLLPRLPPWATNFVTEDAQRLSLSGQQRERLCGLRGILLAAISLAGLSVQASSLNGGPHHLPTRFGCLTWVRRFQFR